MKMKYKIVLSMFFLMSTLLSCDSKKDYLVTITTIHGEIKLILFDDTPLHKANFLELAKAGRYDGTTFHRVIEEFMIQGGDVNAKEGTKVTAEAMVPEEIQAHHIHARGAVAAARTSNPERKSSECQFYIVQGKVWTERELTLDQEKFHRHLRKLLEMPEYQDLRQEIMELQQTGDVDALTALIDQQQKVVEEEFNVSLTKDFPEERLNIYTTVGGAPHLDDEYTVFGQVLEGMEVVDAIAAQPTTAEKPVKDIQMEIEVEEMKKSKITKLYGYQYP